MGHEPDRSPTVPKTAIDSHWKVRYKAQIDGLVEKFKVQINLCSDESPVSLHSLQTMSKVSSQHFVMQIHDFGSCMVNFSFVKKMTFYGLVATRGSTANGLTKQIRVW